MVCSRSTRVLGLVGLVAATLPWAIGPDLSASPDSVAAPRLEPLLSVDLPAAAIPEGPVIVTLGHWTWEPEATATVPDGAWPIGIVVDRVLQGSYAARSGGIVLIDRAGSNGPAEAIPAGTEFVVNVGDGAAYLQDEASWDFRNNGTTQGVGLGGGIFSTDPSTNPDAEVEIGIELTDLAFRELDGWTAGSDGMATFSFWRATLAPEQAIPPADVGSVQLVAADPAERNPTLATTEDGAARNDGTEPVAVFGLTLAP